MKCGTGGAGVEWLTESAVTNSEKYFKMQYIAVSYAPQATL